MSAQPASLLGVESNTASAGLGVPTPPAFPTRRAGRPPQGTPGFSLILPEPCVPLGASLARPSTAVTVIFREAFVLLRLGFEASLSALDWSRPACRTLWFRLRTVFLFCDDGHFFPSCFPYDSGLGRAGAEENLLYTHIFNASQPNALPHWECAFCFLSSGSFV